LNPSQVSAVDAVQPSAHSAKLIEQRMGTLHACTDAAQTSPALSLTWCPQPKTLLLALQASRNFGEIAIGPQIRQCSNIRLTMQLIPQFPQLCVGHLAVCSAALVLHRRLAGTIHGSLDHYAGQCLSRKRGILTIGPANYRSNWQIFRRGYQHDLSSALAPVGWIGAR
jgi:hypothetical protein